MAKDVRVSKIDIEIGDVEVSITPKQAKQLLEALTELVGEKKVVERVIERDRYYNPYIWPNRWYTEPITIGDTTRTISWTTDNTAKVSITA